ncbi:MAG: hypothetical protein HZB46_05130 [Solirubrobacterales bacterium]|nr:hypothetical protein [Solirubrobacterales bacterium]
MTTKLRTTLIAGTVALSILLGMLAVFSLAVGALWATVVLAAAAALSAAFAFAADRR